MRSATDFLPSFMIMFMNFARVCCSRIWDPEGFHAWLRRDFWASVFSFAFGVTPDAGFRERPCLPIGSPAGRRELLVTHTWAGPHTTPADQARDRVLRRSLGAVLGTALTTIGLRTVSGEHAHRVVADAREVLHG